MIETQTLGQIEKCLANRVPSAHLNSLLQNMNQKKIAPGRTLFAEGTIDNNNYYVVDGILKMFFEKDDKKIITNLIKPGETISNLPTPYTEGLAWATVEAVSHVQLLYITKETLLSLIKISPELSSVYLDTITKNIQKASFRLQKLQLLSAAEKYAAFKIDYAEFVEELPQYEIASFLNITSETLCRLKRGTNK